jgi:hypothetical protein
MDIDIRRVLNAHPDYLLFGHLHFPLDRCDGGIRRINPGALYRADGYTVAVLDLESDELQFLPISG